MNDFDAVKKLQAWVGGRALPVGDTVLWPRLEARQTLVVAFVRMAGETSPWAVAWGTPDRAPRVSSVTDPRRVDDVRAMAMDLGRDLLAWFGHPSTGRSIDVESTALVLPGSSHVELLHFLEYRYSRARRVPEAELATVNAVGRLCGWLFRESNRPSQTLVYDVTRCLREGWSVPAEDLRLQHLGFLLGWLTTQGDRDARVSAAEEAEGSAVGITLDPTLERDALEPPLSAWTEARKQGAEDKFSARRIRDVVEEEVRRRWELAALGWKVMQQDPRPSSPALEALSRLAQNEYLWQWRKPEERRESGEDVFVPDPETDRAGHAAASRFFLHQYFADEAANAILHGDNERLAQAVLSGDALLGRLSEVRDEGVRRATVPVWTIQSPLEAPTRFREGSKVEVAGQPGRVGVIRSMTRNGTKREVVVEITGNKTARGGFVHAASDTLRGTTVALLGSNLSELSRTKSQRVWDGDGAGAWLTHGHRIPPADPPRTSALERDRLVRLVNSLGGAR